MANRSTEWLDTLNNKTADNTGLAASAVHRNGDSVHRIEPYGGLLDVVGAARYISMSARWLYKNYQSLPHIRIGNGSIRGNRPRIRFRKADLDSWIAKHRIVPNGME